ncbi:MAG TPA: AI-2E family transporter [Candidatus Sulfopaludibacter sp.]|jgi:predicted PurR-regulated permease PerM|nr:AI-2E family transporter [Candidatus Sulfopaludibacter sp.]
MLGIDRRAASYTWTAALVLLLLSLIYHVRTTLFVFIVAVLFAYLLSPLVNLLDRFLPGTRTRTLALALAYLLIVALAVIAVIQVGGIVADQAKDLQQRLPNMLQTDKTPSTTPPSAFDTLKAQVVDRARSIVAERSGDVVSALASAGVKFVNVASGLIYVVIIPILAFFFLKDAGEIRQHVLDLIPDESRRALVEDIVADIHRLLAHYMRALFVLSLAAFTAYSIFFSIVGVPYGVLLGAIGGMLEFIPMVGPLTADVLILIVALVAKAPVGIVLIFLLVYRIFQDYVVSPHLMGQGVEVHPLLVLFGVFAGAELAGVPGTFLSVPILALVRILYLRIRRARLTPTVPI